MKSRADLLEDVQVLRKALKDYLEATEGCVRGAEDEEEKARQALKSVEPVCIPDIAEEDRFMEWVVQRLVHKHGDPENADFICKLQRIRMKNRRRLTLIQRVARLNPDAGEIGAGMLASLVVTARDLERNAE